MLGPSKITDLFKYPYEFTDDVYDDIDITDNEFAKPLA